MQSVLCKPFKSIVVKNFYVQYEIAEGATTLC